MRIILICAASLLHFGLLEAQRQPITAANATLAVGATTLLLLDRGMTEHALRDGRRELNPIIGPRPSVGRLNAYVAACAVGELGVGFLLHDAKARNFWWGSIALMELAVITHNASMRIPIRF